jgi:UDP-2-acetamido-2,6-beta-L-arabino-hexul-4-ose reductase
MRTRVEMIEVHSDARGYVFEPIAKDPIMNQKNVHVVVSEPGAIRGNHFHKNGTEIIAVMGPALMRLKETEKRYDIEVPEGEVHRFTIPPQVSHAIKNTGQQPNILVAFNTMEHDPDRPDHEYDNLM